MAEKSMHQKMIGGEITWKEYRERRAITRGFKSYKEQVADWRHKTGRCEPIGQNKAASQYLGVYIAEGVLSKIFNGIQRMPYNNKGFDFLCLKGLKIEVKSSCLVLLKAPNGEIIPRWQFEIGKNKIADYFLLVAFDNRIDLIPQHIWLIKSSEIVGRNRNSRMPINQKTALRIFDREKNMMHYQRYEQIDKLEKMKSYCDTLRGN